MSFGKNIMGAFSLSLSLISAQADAIRPGLWEYTSNIKTQSGEMEKSMRQMEQQMASIPPEQRKMMESMMAAQGVSIAPKANTIRVCVSPQDAKLGMVPPTDGTCKQQILRRSGNSIWFKFECTGEHRSSGEGEYTFTGNKAYKGKMKVKTQSNGKSETIDMVQSGKWISDKCPKK